MSFIVNGLKDLESSYKQVAGTLAKAEARAVNRVGVSIVTAQTREIAATVNLRSGTIKRELVIKRKATPAATSVAIEVRGRGVPLKEFIGTTQTRKGVNVRVLKKGPRSTLRAAFGLSAKGGNYFGRAGQGTKRYGSPHVGRLPIVKLYGPNVQSQFTKPEVERVGDTTWQTRLPIELDRETTFALRKAGMI